MRGPRRGPPRTCDHMYDNYLHIPHVPLTSYLHIPHGTLRRDIWHRLEHEQLTNSAPLAIFGGSPFVSRQAETILREEGFTQLCNVQTYKYLRKLVQICGTDRAA